MSKKPQAPPPQRRVISIRYKLGLAFFVGVFGLVLALVGFQQFHSYRQFRSYVEHNSVMTVRAAIMLTERWSVERVQAMQLLAYGASRLESQGGDIATDFRGLAIDAGFTSARIGYEDGRLVTPEGTRQESRFKNEDWYREVSQRRTGVPLPPRKDAATGKYKVSFAAPLYDDKGWLLKGVVVADVFLEELKPVIGSVFMAEVDELIPFSLGKDKAGMFVRTRGLPDKDIDAILKGLSAAGERNGEASTIKIGDTRYEVVLEELEGTGITVAYPVPLSLLVRPLLVQAVAVFIMTAVGLWIITKIVWSVLRGFLTRLEDLNAKTKKVAEGNFDLRIETKSRDEVGQLAGSFNHMVEALKKYMKDLEQTVREKEQIAKELEIASELQQGALPKELPHLVGLEISAKSLPARSVGGDYYDFLYPGNEKVGLIIADAAGKGFPGSFYMSNSRTIFRIVSRDDPSPANILKNINDHVVRENPELSGMFITYIYGIYDSVTQKLTYANAGHFPPLLYRAAERDFLPMKCSGMPVGIMAEQEYDEESVPFTRGDILVLYTDGVIEGVDTRGEMFGLERVMEIVRANAADPAAAILDRIAAAVEAYSRNMPQHDDITLVVAKIVGLAAAAQVP